MIRKLFLVILLLFIFFNYGFTQKLPFDTLLNRSKAEFKKDSGNNYALVVSYLNKALLQRPNNAEAHYFLAYAYSRINSSDAATIADMKLPFVIKTSEQLEKLIKVSPKYNGEILALDPYSKLTSEWGTMAFCYSINNKPDSVIWALREGKRRGGFDDFILSECNIVLQSCSKNAVLISSGDNFFFPFLYLQRLLHVRNDVNIIDAGMISTKWYPKYLVQKEGIKFDVKPPELDTLDYKVWADSTISIPIEGTNDSFKWVVMPSYDKTYILRGDRILLSFLKENKFRRDVYFTKGFVEDDELSLPELLLELPIVDKLNVRHEAGPDDGQYIIQLKQIFGELKPSNKNSSDEQYPIEYLRRNVVNRIALDINLDKKKQAIDLIALLDNYLPESKYPYSSDDLKGNLDSLRKKLQ